MIRRLPGTGERMRWIVSERQLPGERGPGGNIDPFPGKTEDRKQAACRYDEDSRRDEIWNI